MDEPPVIDAKFKVIRPPRRWRLYIDWRSFLVISALAVALAARAGLGVL